MTGTATFVASSATRARVVSDLASRVVPVMARGEKSCGRGRGVVALSCSFGTKNARNESFREISKTFH